MLKVLIACPYNQSDKSICHEQFAAATQLATAVLSRDVLAYSAVTHDHPILAQHSGSVPSQVTMNLQKLTLLTHSWADALFVVDLPGTSECPVTQADIAFFRNAEKPIRFIAPNNIEDQLDTLFEELKRSVLLRCKKLHKER